MRKLLALLIGAALMLSVAACSDSGNTDNADDQTQEVQTETNDDDTQDEDDVQSENSDLASVSIEYSPYTVTVTFDYYEVSTLLDEIPTKGGFLSLSIDGMRFQLTYMGDEFEASYSNGDIRYNSYNDSPLSYLIEGNKVSFILGQVDDFGLSNGQSPESLNYTGFAGDDPMDRKDDEYYFEAWSNEVEILVNVSESETATVTNLDNDMFLIEDGVLVEYRGTDTDVVIPDGVTTIGQSVFRETPITSVSIPESVIIIEYDAFAYCENLASIELHEGITEIGSYAFFHCKSLTSVTIPSTVKMVGKEAFVHCDNLSDLTISDGVSEISYLSFAYNPGLTSITIPGSIKIIADSSFTGCDNLTTVIIEEGVTEIEEDAFQFSPSLTSVTIPSTVTTIGSFAFNSCPNLQLEIPSTVTTVGENVF